MEIVLDAKSSFSVGSVAVSKLVISKINFVNYAECFKVQLREMSKSDNVVEATKAFRRAKRMKQVTAYNKEGGIIPLTQINFGQMPRKLFVKIDNAIDQDNDVKGEVISKDGDGLLSPILYKLGTPFPFTDSTIGSKPIGTESKVIELEFIAKTGGDIEEVLCGENTLDQTIALIKTCATPIGGETALSRLPSWMIEALTLQDGIEIMAKVLPVFIE